MITKETKKKIIEIWDGYVKSNRTVLDTKGIPILNIDENRNKAIDEIKILLNNFINGDWGVFEFKTSLDSYNKRNNLWGFTAIKGQMYFNQLVNVNLQNVEKLESILKKCITEPKDLKDALAKIDSLEKFTNNFYSKADDKRKAPKPSSVGYFLSYFWQLHSPKKWPIIYTSLIDAYEELGIWETHQDQKRDYEYFFKLNEEVKIIVENYINKSVENWDVEHAFWGRSKINKNYKIEKEVSKDELVAEVQIKANFKLEDYLIPIVANLSELGERKEVSVSKKGSDYERLVAEIFKQLDFEVELLGQGSGRNPDAILKFREDNTAFIVDAKAYSNGYVLGTDDRAIKEYINYHCPKLQKEGYKKIGFIIVSNSFKPNFDSFINEITWTTDIKRFILMTSKALLYLLAYKTKAKLSLSTIIESIVGFGNPVTADDVIQEFNDF